MKSKEYESKIEKTESQIRSCEEKLERLKEKLKQLKREQAAEDKKRKIERQRSMGEMMEAALAVEYGTEMIESMDPEELRTLLTEKLRLQSDREVS